MFEAERRRESRPSLLFPHPDYNLQRARLWETLYLDFGLPPSFKEIYPLNGLILESDERYLFEMHDVVPPPIESILLERNPFAHPMRVLDDAEVETSELMS